MIGPKSVSTCVQMRGCLSGMWGLWETIEFDLARKKTFAPECPTKHARRSLDPTPASGLKKKVFLVSFDKHPELAMHFNLVIAVFASHRFTKFMVEVTLNLSAAESILVSQQKHGSLTSASKTRATSIEAGRCYAAFGRRRPSRLFHRRSGRPVRKGGAFWVSPLEGSSRIARA